MDKVTVAKMEDRVVEIVRFADKVMFSEDRGWICICMDIGKKSSGAVKWVPASTKFEWVRVFAF
jgi:hypothetical protein